MQGRKGHPFRGGGGPVQVSSVSLSMARSRSRRERRKESAMITDPTIIRIGELPQLSHQGERRPARRQFAEIWNEIGGEPEGSAALLQRLFRARNGRCARRRARRAGLGPTSAGGCRPDHRCAGNAGRGNASGGRLLLLVAPERERKGALASWAIWPVLALPAGAGHDRRARRRRVRTLDQGRPAAGGGRTSRPVRRVLSTGALRPPDGRPSISACRRRQARAVYPQASGGQPSNACAGRRRRRPFLALLRVGFTEPPRSPGVLVVSYTTVSPLPGRRDAHWRSVLCGTVPRVTPGCC